MEDQTPLLAISPSSRLGDSVYPLDAWRLAGVDMSAPEPVEQAFGALEQMIDRLDALVGTGPLE